MTTASTSHRPHMLFGERAFGAFFLLWGCILIADTFFPIAHHGLFLGEFEHVMPTCAWGIWFALLGAARFVAFRLRSACWRLRLSLISFLLLAIIAAMSLYSGLWAATAPLTIFVAYVSFWAHHRLRRDLRLGL